MRSAVFVFAVLFLSFCTALPTGVFRKRLAGPPSEFDQFKPVDVSQVGTSSRHAWLPFELQQNEEGEYSWQQQLPVDAENRFGFAVSTPYSANTIVTLLDPNGVVVDLRKYAAEGQFHISADARVPTTTHMITDALIGTYTIRISTVGADSVLKSKLDASSNDDGVIVWFNDEDIQIYTHFSHYRGEVGESIGSVTRVFDSSLHVATEENSVPVALQDHVVSSTVVMKLPDGSKIAVPMHDDGLHADSDASDGVFASELKTTQVGKHTVHTIVRGRNTNGHEFIRTSYQHFEVVPQLTLAAGKALATKNTNQNRLEISLIVDAEDNTRDYRAHAEVWGKGTNNEDVPISWIGGLFEVEDDKIVLELDLNWIVLAGARGPYSLRNVQLEDIEGGYVTVETIDEIEISLDGNSKAAIATALYTVRASDIEISSEMREGVMPEYFAPANMSEAGAGYLLLLPGYCTASNPWSGQITWTGGWFFTQSAQSLSNDQFAQNVIGSLASTPLKTAFYALVGHSQGGLVSLHIRTYYFQANPPKPSGRQVQSVGSPYQGTSAAGSVADLGDIFGVGCGSNNDLSTSGAPAWLSKIPSANKALVNYYTTTYKLGTFFGDDCELAMQLILDWPNDGVTEQDNDALPGGVALGNTQKQCHTTGMNYSPQYTDTTRDAQINTNAARF